MDGVGSSRGCIGRGWLLYLALYEGGRSKCIEIGCSPDAGLSNGGLATSPTPQWPVLAPVTETTGTAW